MRSGKRSASHDVALLVRVAQLAAMVRCVWICNANARMPNMQSDREALGDRLSQIREAQVFVPVFPGSEHRHFGVIDSIFVHGERMQVQGGVSVVSDGSIADHQIVMAAGARMAAEILNLRAKNSDEPVWFIGEVDRDAPVVESDAPIDGYVPVCA